MSSNTEKTVERQALEAIESEGGPDGFLAQNAIDRDDLKSQNPFVFSYTNWRGKRSTRRVIPRSVWYGASEYHSGQQWFMRAYDIEKQSVRDFALDDISEL